jgi:hypothetical protein
MITDGNDVNITAVGAGNSLRFFWAANGTNTWHPETVALIRPLAIRRGTTGPPQAAGGPSKHAAARSRKAWAAGSRRAKDGQQCLDGPWLAMIAGDLTPQCGEDVGRGQVQLVE